MDWAKILAPLSGGEADKRTLAAAAEIARAFDAELAAAHAPADVADLIPWMGDGFMGGVQATAIDSIRQAAAEGEKYARAALEGCGYAKTSFTSLTSPVWAALAMEGRLADLVVFDDTAARGKGPLAEAFQQIVADEQRPTLVARPGLKADGVIAVAWDGGKEASRAMRTALPLLQKASQVVILSAPASSARKFDPAALQAFLAARQVATSVTCIKEGGDAGPLLIKAAHEVGANLLVAGAFGHPRLQEFIFGGTSKTFLQAQSPSLFLSH